MLQNLNKIGVVILAAGKGTRMNSDKLKVMHELNGQPLIDCVVKSVENLDLEIKPIVVVCNEDHSVQDFLGNRAEYAVQKERLGTGHAVMSAENVLKGKAEVVVVLYGDMPFIKPESIKKLIDKHLEKNNQLTLMTAVVDDFEDWRSGLYNYGRIIRGGAEDHILKIVEKKDATQKELEVKEVSTCFFCFNADWLWKNLKLLKNDSNNQKEYYLTDLVQIAESEGEKMSSITIDPKEALGINTLEDLEKANKIENI